MTRHLPPLVPWLIWILLHAGIETSAQPLENGARVAGLGGAGAALTDHFSVRLNPASIHQVNTPFLTSGYSRAFGIPELDHYLAAVGTRAGPVRFATAIESFGFDLFRSQSLHANVAGQLVPGRLSLGIALTAERQIIRSGGGRTTTEMAVGALALLADRVGLGVAVRRIVMLPGQPNNGRLVMAGIALHLTPAVIVLADVHKDANFDPALRAGIEARPVPAVILRVGVSTFPESASLGTGFKAGPLRFDLAMQRHYLLGWSKAFALGFGA